MIKLKDKITLYIIYSVYSTVIIMLLLSCTVRYDVQNTLLSDEYDFDVHYTNNDIDKIIDASVSYTANKLEFDKKTTHCVTYANYMTSLCNYLIKKNDLECEWKAFHKRGHIYLGNINIHNHLGNNKFVRDHDFVCIEHKLGKMEDICVDPSLYEFTLINRIRVK